MIMNLVSDCECGYITQPGRYTEAIITCGLYSGPCRRSLGLGMEILGPFYFSRKQMKFVSLKLIVVLKFFLNNLLAFIYYFSPEKDTKLWINQRFVLVKSLL